MKLSDIKSETTLKGVVYENKGEFGKFYTLKMDNDTLLINENTVIGKYFSGLNVDRAIIELTLKPIEKGKKKMIIPLKIKKIGMVEKKGFQPVIEGF